MNDSSICWINGNIIPSAQATISVHDHGLLYGDGVFEGLRYYHNRAFMLDEHLDRLLRSAAAIALDVPRSTQEISDAIEQLITRSSSDTGYLRLVVTRGIGPLGIDPRSCRQPELFIIADTLRVVDTSKRDQGIKLHIAKTRRTPAACLDPAIKSLNYLNNILARIEANRVGADEAVMLNLDGNITEGSVDNLFIVKHGVLKTPPLEDGMLAGITRQIIIDLARANDIEVHTQSLTIDDLMTADECFLTGTGAELIRVKEIDQKLLPGSQSEVLAFVGEAFRQFIDERCRN